MENFVSLKRIRHPIFLVQYENDITISVLCPHRCFLFDVDKTFNCSHIQSIKIGADGEVCLGFLSLAQILHV